MKFIYPVTLIQDKEYGGFVVKFIDFPEAITQGENIEDALCQASDCLEEAIANRIVKKLSIPAPSPTKKGQYPIPLRVQMTAKAILYLAIKEAGISKAELARRLNWDEKDVRRLIDPRHSSKLPRIEAALYVLNKRLTVLSEPIKKLKAAA